MSAGLPPGGPPPLSAGRLAGSLERRNFVLIGGAATIVLGITIAVLLVQGQVRTIILVLLTLLGLLCLSPRRGIYTLLVFLPFMYFLRRQVLFFQSYSPRDPILLFPPLVTIAMFLGFVIFYSERFFKYTRYSALMKALLALLVLYTAQIFNPLQGNILVGLAGALYLIIPMLWVFMGLLLDRKDMRRILMLIVVIGAVTALYGIYQHYFGLTKVEMEELESKGFLKMLGNETRVMSTFAGIGDFSVYISTAAFVAFAHYWRTRTNVIYPLLIGVIGMAMLWAGSRSSILVLIFSILIFLTIYPQRPGQLLLRAAVITLAVGSIYGYLYTTTPQQLFESYRTSDPFVVHTVSGIAHPTEESTFRKRIGTWTWIASKGLLQQPFGCGLGSTTPAANKFSGGMGIVTDSYFFGLIYGCSLLAAILFILIFVLFFKNAVNLALSTRDNFQYKVVIGMVAAYVLGSVFGGDLGDSINAPIGWLAIGWMVREVADHDLEKRGLAVGEERA